nr:helix-turn-helix domain-containing protein [Tychonema sp. BBK16]
MTPTKLSDSDKREIIRLYRQSDENTITLAKRYGVSSSTVRRLVQSAVSVPEYESLVQQKQKRLSDRTTISQEAEVTVDLSSSPSSSDPLSSTVDRSSVANSRPTIRRRFLSAAEPVADIEEQGNLSSYLNVSDESAAGVANSGDRSDEVVITAELRSILPAEGLLGGEDFSDFD